MPQVSVIGGGVIGLLSALRLQQRGANVTVYDKSYIGNEASWAAAGLLAPSVEQAPDYAFASRDAFPALIKELGGDIPYARCGLECEGTFYPDEAWVDPRALLKALITATTRAGVLLKPHVRADATVGGDLVVIAAGAWSADLAKVTVKPIKGVLLRLKAHVSHIHFWHDGYVCPRPNGECIVGSSIEDTSFDKAIDEEEASRVLTRAIAHVPALAGAAVLDRWTGLRPHASAPILRREGRLIIATGHYRSGILLAPYTADWVAASAMAQSGK